MRAKAFKKAMALLGGWGLTVAGLISLGGCELPKISPEHQLPPLVTLHGTAEIPDDYLVMAGTMPAPRGFRVSLAKLDGTVLANGSIVSDSGEFSVSVPQTSLTKGTAIYEVTLRNGLGAAVYSAPVRIQSNGASARVQIDAASTAVLLAVKTAQQMGRSVSSWNFTRLAQDAQVKQFAQRIARDAAERSNLSPGQTLLSSFPLPEEFQSGVYQVISIAERLSN